MFEVVAFAFVACVAFVVIGKTVTPDHHPDPEAWKHIGEHDRLYYMRRGKKRTYVRP